MNGFYITIVDASVTELLRPVLYDSGHSIENLEMEGLHGIYAD